MLNSFKLALKSIWSNRLRSFLTMLGIIIGVAAVIILVGIVNGEMSYMTESFASMGTNRITVNITNLRSRSVDVDEMYDFFEDKSQYFSYMSPTVTVGATVKVGNENSTTTKTTGVSEDYLYTIFKDDDLYTVTAMSELLDSMNEMIGTMSMMLGGIASISLLVAGVGVMNIMLVSVTERTREIGIRKALGAKRRTILSQFVIEAAVTSSLGGFIGIAVGFVGTSAAGKIMGIDASPTFLSVLVSFMVSVMIGLIFGYLPARRAAALNPIDALRSD
ncbi:ABC transporter permease [Oribacterium sp. HCP3S3_B9]|uniref:ABC transporter permease n=1 Tax=Oribacterium sp. HCP3S3_B9 TaxID=3438946 RepID=UPI003F890ECA